MFKFGKYKVSSEKLSAWGKKAADAIDDTIEAVEAAMAQDSDESEDDSYFDDSGASTSNTEKESGSGNTDGDSANEDYYDSSS